MTPRFPPPEPAAQVTNGMGNGPPEAEASPSGESVATGEPSPPEGGGEALPVEGSGYQVELDSFAGPLDLLLYLIRKEEVEITDIPISLITDQYLRSIDDLGDLDLDRAGEYLLMAATLMRIKAKLLIPRDPDDEDDEDEIDPREELVRRLLEYREFKSVAEGLKGRQEEWRGIFSRGTAPLPEIESEELDDLDVSLVDIFRAFRKILDQLETVESLDMLSEEYSVDEQMSYIRTECEQGDEEGVPFSRLFEGKLSRSLVITTFLALLEMVREREIMADQIDRFGEIWLRLRKEAQKHESGNEG